MKNEPKKSNPHTPENRTNDLIGFLSKDSKRQSAQAAQDQNSLRFKNYLGYWMTGAAVIGALSILLLPSREDLAERSVHWETWINFPLWFLAAFLSALKVYSLAFPDGSSSSASSSGVIQKWSRFAIAPLGTIAALTVFSLNRTDLPFQLYRESNYMNGGCGMVILVAGAIHVGFLYSWLRKGATTQPLRSGAWAAISTGAFTSFVIQFACANENAFHVLLWHFIPLSALTFISAMSARKLLRW